MKQLYNRILPGVFICIFLIAAGQKTLAQCPYGFPSGQVAYDTSIATPPGINTLYVKFPQADPADGYLTCLQICISITGVVDSVSVENNSATSQTANIYYTRSDQISGPGLSSPLTNSINHHYGPYNLGGTAPPLGAGPDFIAISHDTLLNAVTTCALINNPDSLFQFYGTDSVTYLYDISAFTNVTCTGGNYNSTVATSAVVRFQFKYCTCPGLILPLTIGSFKVDKIADNKANLSWTDQQNAEQSPVRYEVEMSRNAINFTSVGEVPPNQLAGTPYQFPFTTSVHESGIFYFRIRQVYANGYSRFSAIRSVTLKNSDAPAFILFPNPSSGEIGIKFAYPQNDRKRITIFNAQSQKVLDKTYLTTGTVLKIPTNLPGGIYWIRISDEGQKYSSVNQLYIQ